MSVIKKPSLKAAGTKVDYEALFRRTQSILVNLMVSSGAIWTALEKEPELRDTIKQQLNLIDGESGSEHLQVLVDCAEKMNEINGADWRADPDKLKVNVFDSDEFIVKYPELNSDSTYFFRVVGGEVSVMLIE